jgi:hypothetical protein
MKHGMQLVDLVQCMVVQADLCLDPVRHDTVMRRGIIGCEIRWRITWQLHIDQISISHL